MESVEDTSLCFWITSHRFRFSQEWNNLLLFIFAFMGSVWGNRMTQVKCLPDKHTMADCFVIIQFPQEVFEIPQGFIRAFVKAILLGKDDSFGISSCCGWRVCRLCWNEFSIRDNPLNLLTLSFLRAVWYSLKNKVSDKNWLRETNMVPMRHLRES